MEDLGGGIQGIALAGSEYFVTRDEVEPGFYHLTNGEDNEESNIYFTAADIIEIVTHW
jgi:hypothetical protein